MKKVIIIGGGTSSWLLALTLLKKTQLKVVMVNSDKVEKIGVGESTFPIFLSALNALDVNIQDLIVKCDCTLKLAIVFKNWTKNKIYFEHLFRSNIEAYENNNIFLNGIEYCSDYIFHIKNNTIPNDLNLNNYSIQFSSEKIVNYLKDLCLKYERRFLYLKEHVLDFKFDESQYIEEVITENQTLQSDFVFDCTGFNSLISKKNNKKWISFSKELLNNSAFVVRREYSENESISNFTEVLRKDYGWMWSVPLYNNISHGYVYSNDFVDEQQIIDHMVKKYSKNGIISTKKVKFSSGYYENPLEKNYCLIGLASNFIEPMESTAITLTQIQINQILPLIKNDTIFHSFYQKNFNKKTIGTVIEVKNFLMLIYKFCHFNYNDYWKYIENIDNDYINSIDTTIKYDSNNMYSSFDIDQICRGYDYYPKMFYDLKFYYETKDKISNPILNHYNQGNYDNHREYLTKMRENND